MQYNPNTGPYNMSHLVPPRVTDHNGNVRDENTGEYLPAATPATLEELAPDVFPRRPIVGDSVRVNTDGRTGAIVLDDNSPRLPFRVKFADDDSGWFGPADLTVVPPSPVAPVGAASVAEVEALRATLADVRSQLTRAMDAHREDIATIGAALIHEATEREWCSEYDGVVAELNRHLSVELPPRKTTTTLRITDEDGYERYTLEVNGTDEDDAVSELVDAVENITPEQWTYHILDENGSRLQSVTVYAETEASGAEMVLDAARHSMDLANYSGRR